ncbi:PREDICTED: 40S ribosomal [Prunus dulcis]|uniref:PREDICTED: 40S ribosomal n=1 Tax=Prunus dulcis TaxID=3755 RepID=A0A5E4F7D2_PRUDU|nr:PREDICTED: 40S ribosomal [Prunus dulcis]
MSPLNSNPSGAYHSYSNEQKAKVCSRRSVFCGAERGVDQRARRRWCGPRSLLEPPGLKTSSVRREEELENWHLLFRSVLSFRRTDICLSNESLRYKLLGGLAVRRACYGVLRFVMESGAKGCSVIVSGKLRAQRAKSMKFKDRYMISSGQPVNEYIDSAVRHVLLRRGVLGMKVKIMLDWDPKGKQGPTMPLPDLVTIHQPKEEGDYIRPSVVAAAEIPVLAA